MNYKYIFAILILIILISGCGKKQKPEVPEIDIDTLETEINELDQEEPENIEEDLEEIIEEDTTLNESELTLETEINELESYLIRNKIILDEECLAYNDYRINLGIIDKNKLLGIVNVDSAFCQLNPYFSSKTPIINQACCFNSQVVSSGILATDQYNRFLCVDGKIYDHIHGTNDIWTTHKKSCNVVGNYFAFPNYPNAEWQGGWIKGNGENVICADGKICDGKGFKFK